MHQLAWTKAWTQLSRNLLKCCFSGKIFPELKFWCVNLNLEAACYFCAAVLSLSLHRPRASWLALHWHLQGITPAATSGTQLAVPGWWQHQTCQHCCGPAALCCVWPCCLTAALSFASETRGEHCPGWGGAPQNLTPAFGFHIFNPDCLVVTRRVRKWLHRLLEVTPMEWIRRKKSGWKSFY